jgi:cysteine desulfuration protein SufE
MEADSPVVKGLVALLCDLYNGADPAEAASFEPELFAALGLERNLSPTRLHGLGSVLEAIRTFAQSSLPS